MNGKFHSAKRGLVAAVFIAIVAADCVLENALRLLRREADNRSEAR